MFGKTVYRKEVPKASGAEALWGQRKLGSLLIRAHREEGEERRRRGGKGCVAVIGQSLARMGS